MKTSSNDHVVESQGIGESTAFSFKSTPKAFDILSSGLYSDKILAVIRELSANAWDAHKMAGCEDKPFHVQLPTRLEPIFSIRDFGTGLSNHDVHHLYSTYFDSTKSDSNDFIGALGLGSKSPFSYTDSFTVTSWHGGKKQAYALFLDGGVPKITEIGPAEDTNELGIEVKIACRMKDMDSWHKRALSCYLWYSVKPRVTGCNGEDFQNEISDMNLIEQSSGKDWALIRNAGRAETSFIQTESIFFGRQGNIIYPISIQAIADEMMYDDEGIIIHNSPYARTIGFMRTMNSTISDIFVIDFNMGELDVAASRESLSYKKHTINNIKNKLDIIMKDMIDVYKNEFDDIETKWNLICTVKEKLDHRGDDLFKILVDKNIVTNIEWKGNTYSIKELKYPIVVEGVKEEANGERINISEYNTSSGWIGRHSGFDKPRIVSGTNFYKHPPFNIFEQSEDIFCTKVEPESRYVIVCNNVIQSELIMNRKMKSLLHDFNTTILYHNKKVLFLNNANIFEKRFNQAQYDDVIKQLGNPKFIMLDDVEINKSLIAVGGPTHKVFKFIKQNYRTKTNYHWNSRSEADPTLQESSWSQTSIEEDAFEDGGLYVPMVRWLVAKDTNEEGYGELGIFIEHLRKLKLIDSNVQEVYGVRNGQDRKDFDKADNWINLFDYASKVFDDKYSTKAQNNILISTSKRVALDSIKHRWFYNFHRHISKGVVEALEQFFDKTTDFHKNLTMLNTQSSTIDKETLTAIEYVCKILKKKSIDLSEEYLIENEIGYIKDSNKMLTTYPLLKQIDSTNYNNIKHNSTEFAELMQSINDYIRLIEQ